MYEQLELFPEIFPPKRYRRANPYPFTGDMEFTFGVRVNGKWSVKAWNTHGNTYNNDECQYRLYKAFVIVMRSALAKVHGLDPDFSERMRSTIPA